MGPQMVFGVSNAYGLYANVGLGDLRDNLRIESQVGFLKQYATKGDDLSEFLHNVKATANSPELPIIDALIQALPEVVADVLDHVGVNVNHRYVEGTVNFHMFVGLVGVTWLGWQDTKGFHMVGARAKAAAALGIDGGLICGLNADATKCRIMLFVPHCGIDVVFHLADKDHDNIIGLELDDRDLDVNVPDCAERVVGGLNRVRVARRLKEDVRGAVRSEAVSALRDNWTDGVDMLH